MSVMAQVAWSPQVLNYDFGRGHPMSPVRLRLTMGLARALGVVEGDGIAIVDDGVASDALLSLVHEPDYVAAVRAAADHGAKDIARGLGTEDDPVFSCMHESAARIVASTVGVARAVWSGRAMHGVNVAGGMHHAMPGAAAGFCIYNDAAVAIQDLLDSGAQRVAYIDLDAHHGDGVEQVFWNDPRVLTVSLHQSPATLFPGTGFPTDVGGPEARGTAVNVALPPRTDGRRWLRAFRAVVPPLIRNFAPQIIVSQHGCDSHGLDPLSELNVGIAAQSQSVREVHELAHEVSEGRWVALGGGGYAVIGVVPVAWTNLLSIVTHRPIDPETRAPHAWRAAISQEFDYPAPLRLGGDDDTDLTDVRDQRPWSQGYDPYDDVDRAIAATRTAVFPLLGLVPEGY